VVVEAMKMENELRASREGTVAEIHASEGMSVDAGALLVVIQ
jgi:acetyl-CoA/propionyl-CoA carboxylase biotin carboxyl carrier protein